MSNNINEEEVPPSEAEDAAESSESSAPKPGITTKSSHPSKKSSAAKRAAERKAQEKAKRKKKTIILSSIGGAAVIIGIILASVFFQGARLQLSTSVNPVGWYNLTVWQGNQFQQSELNFNIEIVAANNTLVQTIPVTAGMFSNGVAQTDAYYVATQSYAVIVHDGIQTTCIPIECSANQGSPQSNTINYIRRADNTQISADIEFSELPSDTGVGYQYQKITPPATYTTATNGNYTTFVQLINHNSSNSEPSDIGQRAILPDYIVQKYYPIMWAINQTNYEANCILFKGSLNNVSASDPSYNPDVTLFMYQNVNYTMITLPELGTGSPISEEYTFTTPQATVLSYTVFQGAIDVAFTSSWQYFKLGGF
jgi:hypothetical protein